MVDFFAASPAAGAGLPSPVPAASGLLERQASRESNARSYPRRLPIALKRARGIHVEDVEGRVYIDCLAGAGTLALGHNHPAVIAAIRQVLDDELPLHTLDLTTPVKDAFVQDLFDVLPAGMADRARIQFCGPTGADAVEAALKLARTATGRKTVLAFRGGYHGMTQGTLAVMGNHGPKQALDGLFPAVQFLPFPYDYRCPFGLGGEAGVAAGLNYIETLLSDPESGVLPPAAVIVEAVQGEGGVVPAAPQWLRGLADIVQGAGVPLVLDEVQTGFGRTGTMFAFEHAGIRPDILVFSKAIGGSLPLSVVVYDQVLDTWKPGAHAGTFRGNQLAMAAGSATLRVIRETELPAHAEAMGARLMSQLQEHQQAWPQLGDVRGLGLMIGVEIVDPDGQPDRQGHAPADPDLAGAIQRECLKRGLILELGGRHGAVVRFLPPLVIGAPEIDDVSAIFATAVAAAVHNRQHGAGPAQTRSPAGDPVFS